MLIVLMILTALAVIITVVTFDDWDMTPFLTMIGSIILGILDIICIIFIISYFEKGIVANQKIKMYQVENKQIEERINLLVKQYMEYEGKTLKDFKSENSMTLVSLYPNLKSDELVKKQIDTYIENNKKIKELKEQQIDLKIGKWLLYFGG